MNLAPSKALILLDNVDSAYELGIVHTFNKLGTFGNDRNIRFAISKENCKITKWG